MRLIIAGTMLLIGSVQPVCSAELATAAAAKRYVTVDPIPVLESTSAVGQFNAMVIFLAEQLERNMDRKSVDSAYIVTTFSRLDKLNDSTNLGRLLSENLGHELQVRRWQLYDIRLTKDIIVSDAGEFILSRDIKKIRDSYKVNGVVTGTYAVNGSSIIVNARVIDLETGTIISSGQIHLPVNRFMENLLYNYEQRAMVRIIGDK